MCIRDRVISQHIPRGVDKARSGAGDDHAGQRRAVKEGLARFKGQVVGNDGANSLLEQRDRLFGQRVGDGVGFFHEIALDGMAERVDRGRHGEGAGQRLGVGGVAEGDFGVDVVAGEGALVFNARDGENRDVYKRQALA